MTGIPPASWAVDPSTASATEVLPGVWRLRLPQAWHHVSHVNAYAIGGRNDALVLIDTGSGGHPTARAALERALNLAGFTTADVRDLVVTHFHNDHMGLVGPVSASSGCRIWGHPAHQTYFDVVKHPVEAMHRRRAMSAAEGARGGLLEACASVREESEGADDPVRPTHRLGAGTTVPSPLGELQVVEAPGHCPSQVCLWEPRRRLLFSADLLMSEFSTFCDVEGVEDPIGEFRGAIERVAELDVALALPGHGRPVTDFAGLVESYRNGIPQRLADMAAALGPGHRDTAAVCTAVFGREDHPATAVWRFLETRSYLTHLVAEGRATRTVDGRGRVGWAAAAR
jgi:glyoxylase-like metal-dependent hydrolase (beta-lactamase superfamily II)